jgi:hypothetical protein
MSPAAAEARTIAAIEGKGRKLRVPRGGSVDCLSPNTRTLLQVKILDHHDATRHTVDRLMGNKPEARFGFIQENAVFVTDLDI